MTTEPDTKRIRVRLEREAQEPIDPEPLWHDLSIKPEELIQLDPLDITPEIVEEAEQPELADYNLQSLPAGRFSLEMEVIERKLSKAAFREKHGYTAQLPDSILARQGDGSV